MVLNYHATLTLSTHLIPEGRSKGFAHVDFASSDLASRAVTELNGVELMGRSLRIDYAQRKEDRPAGQESPREVSTSPIIHPSFRNHHFHTLNCILSNSQEPLEQTP